MKFRNLAAALALVGAVFATPIALAGDNVRADQRLSVWTPDPWVVVSGAKRFEAHNPPSSIYVVATRITGAAADAAARVRAFVEEELDEVAFKGDGLSGTAEDEGDDVEFSVRAVVDGADLLVLLIYGDGAVLGQGGPKQAVERIRASLKAQ